MNERTRQDYEKRILRVQMHIQKHLDRQLGTDELAGVACFSPWHFNRIFRAMTGESLMDYARRLKLERSAWDLKYTARPVTEIAFDAGYENHESFSRAFRKKFGVSPRGYRESGSFIDLSPESGIIPDRTIKRYGGIKMQVRIENFEEITVASVRHTGSYFESGTAWQKLCSSESVMKNAVMPSLCVGIGYDDPDITEKDRIRYDACIRVKENFVPEEGIAVQKIMGGKFAVLTHTGSYEGLHDCYRWLYGEWLPSSGYEPGLAPPLEIYRNSPETTPAEELVTDICIPLLK